MNKPTKMHFWLLRRLDDIGWDECEGKVVRATSEEEARRISRPWGAGLLKPESAIAEADIKCERLLTEGQVAEPLLTARNWG